MGGGVSRLQYYVWHPCIAEFWQLLVADDYEWECTSERYVEVLLGCLWLLELFSFPLSWHKVRGGLTFSWVGYELLLAEHAIGVSASRAAWIAAWLSRLLRERATHMGDFSESHTPGAIQFGSLSGLRQEAVDPEHQPRDREHWPMWEALLKQL